MKRLLPLMVCAFIACAAGCCERSAPPKGESTETVYICPAAFGPSGGGCGVIDINNNVIVEPMYDDISIHGKFLVVAKCERLGLLMLDGRVLAPCKYESVIINDTKYTWGKRYFEYDIYTDELPASIPLAVVSLRPGRSMRWEGILFRMDGTPLLGDDFRFREIVNSKYLVVTRVSDGKLRVLDAQGTDVGCRDFDDFRDIPGSPLAAMIAGEKLMIYNADFKRLTDAEIEEVGSFADGMLSVRIGTRWGFMNEEGRLSIFPKFERVGSFGEGLCPVAVRLRPDGEIDMTERAATEPGVADTEGLLWGYIDKTGKFVLPPVYTDACAFNYLCAQVRTNSPGSKEGEWKNIDRTGKEVDDWAAFAWETAQIGDDVSLVREGSKLVWSKTGQVICEGVWPASFDPATGLVFFEVGSRQGFISPRSGYALDLSKWSFEHVDPWSEGLVVGRSDGKACILDYSGNQVGPEYAEIGSLREGLATFRLPDSVLRGYLDAKGSVAIPPAFVGADMFFCGLAAARLDAWGYIDKTGKWAIEPRFDGAYDFEDGLAIVEIGGRWGAIDAEGKQVIPCSYKSLGDFRGGFATFEVGTKWGCVDEKGRVVIEPKFDSMSAFQDGVAVVSTDGAYGAIDARGDVAIPLKYAFLEHVGEGLLVYSLSRIREMRGLIDTGGRLISGPILRLHYPMFEGRMAACLEDLWGFIDSEGKWVVPPVYAQALWFREGLAAVQVKDNYERRWGYVDREGRMVIPPRYFSAGDFSEGRALVSEGGRHGYIDREGKVAIALKYKSGSDFAGGFAEVETELGSCRVDAEGNETPRPSIRLGDKVSNGYIAEDRGAESGKSFGVVDFSGKWIIRPQFSKLHTEDGTYPLTGGKDWRPCYVNEQGEVTFVDAKSLEPFRCGIAECFVPGEGWRVIDRTGRVAFTWPFEIRNFQEVPLPRRAAGEAK